MSYSNLTMSIIVVLIIILILKMLDINEKD